MNIWLIKVGEPLPWFSGEQHHRSWRMGQLAQFLQLNGHMVTFWASQFDHYSKNFRSHKNELIDSGFETILLESRSYSQNMSFRRVLDHRDLAKSFFKEARKLESPDLILVSWPTIELAYSAIMYGISNNVPVVLDVRDCWPDIIYQRVPNGLKWLPKYLLSYERMTKYSFQNANALTAVSNGLLNWAQTRGGRGDRANANDRFFYQAQYDHHVKESGNVFWKKKGIELTADDKVRIVWAGSLEPTLDLKTCLNAIESFSSRNNSKIEFIFCGRGSMEASVRALQKRISNFRFVGHVGETELRDLLAHSNFGLMCYPDRFDFHASIPNKLVDFCMAGMRVITNLDGVLSLLVSPGDALHYKAGDAFSLVEVFDMISINQKRFMAKSRNNRLLYEREFDASSVLPKFCEYLENIRNKAQLSK